MNSVDNTEEVVDKTDMYEQVALQEKRGYFVLKEFEETVVMQRGEEFIKVDSEGFVVPFKPLFVD